MKPETSFAFKLFAFIIALKIKYAISDCGLPAIPYNAQIDRVQQIYYDTEAIEYSCQLKELKLLGNATRQCLGNRWLGALPKCVEELHFGTINVIDLADRRNKSIEYRNKWQNKDPTAAYYVDYKQDKCMRSNKMSRPHSWKIHLAKVKRHISYIELIVLDTNGKLSRTDASQIIKYSKINDVRECVPDIMETMDTALRLSLTCLMEFDGDSKYEAWERDKTQMITIEFDVDDISVCSIRLFTNSFMPFHRCGSADVVLFSTMEFIQSGNKYSSNPYYKYKCDDGFQLDGPEDVRCGLNNNWLDSFPVCKPTVQCPYPPSIDETFTIAIKPEHLYTLNGNLSALVGSIVYYNCLGNGNHSIMIGDSVRVCGNDGKWSGVDPQCIRNSELNADSFKHIEDTNINDKHMTTFESLDKLVTYDNKTALACGIPAMPLFAKPTTSKKYRYFGGQSDLRLWYENGTDINYVCESAYRWVTGDVGKRTCVAGQWTGRIGKCAINWGDKIRLYDIHVYDMDQKGQWVNSHVIADYNKTSEWDEHFAYRRDADKGECATFSVDTKHRWALRLNQSVSITYFVVMLHPGGFFNSKRRINDPLVLETSPITATVGRNKECLLTSAWDYSHSRFGTFFFFTCDMDQPKYRSVSYDYYVNLYIDPAKFDKSYTAKNISVCSLAVMTSKQDCGTPDVPLHSSVVHNNINGQNEWTYTCEEGYKMIGKPTVTCGLNGRWTTDEFPYCVKKALCPVTRPNDMFLRSRWDNLNPNDQQVAAMVDSLVIHSCTIESKKILIGSALRICATNGQWSGTEPYCMDPKDLPKNTTKDSGSTLKVFITVLSILFGIALIVGLIYYVFNKGYFRKVAELRVPNFTIPKINIQRDSMAVHPSHAASPAPAPTPNGGNSYDNPVNFEPIQPPQPKHRSTKINDNLDIFSKGTELLVEPDHSE